VASRNRRDSIAGSHDPPRGRNDIETIRQQYQEHEHGGGVEDDAGIDLSVGAGRTEQGTRDVRECVDVEDERRTRDDHRLTGRDPSEEQGHRTHRDMNELSACLAVAVGQGGAIFREAGHPIHDPDGIAARQ
jgi:hypothetical protein